MAGFDPAIAHRLVERQRNRRGGRVRMMID
jgi:hypothetical protein